MKNLKVAYIGGVAPFEPEFYNQPGYGRPGALAQLGFIEALHSSGLLDRAWGFRPIAHYPRANIQFEWIRRLTLPCGAKLSLMPLFNHFFLREISRFIILAWVVIHWSIQRFGDKRIIVMYNLTQPNGVIWMRLLTWLTHTKLVPIIYDMARMEMYGKSFLMHCVEPYWLDRIHEKFIPLCDGLLPITDAIPHDFAPDLKYLRVDGGIGEAVVSDLPPLSNSNSYSDSNSNFTIFYAGGITPWNRIDILLDYMKQNQDPNLRLWLAGGGRQEQLAKDAAANDSRITFFGFLGPDKLNELYGQCDMLVTLRDLIDPGLKYHYPSKTFEMLAMGKPLVVTNSQHTKEAYGNYCYVIDECSVENYAKGVEFFRAMSPEERLEYGKRARQFALEHKRWCKQGPAIGEYLKSLAIPLLNSNSHSDSRLKVLCIHPALAPYRLDFFNLLAERCDLTVAFVHKNAINQKFNQEALLKNAKFKYTYLSGFDICGRNIRFGVGKLIRTLHPNVVFGYESSPITLLLILIRKLLNISTSKPLNFRLWTHMDEAPDTIRSRKGIRRFIRDFVLRHVDGVIVPSELAVEAYGRAGAPRTPQFSIVPIIHDVNEMRKNEGEVFEMGRKWRENLISRVERVEHVEDNGRVEHKERKVLLYVGRLAEVKNLKWLLERIKELSQTSTSNSKLQTSNLILVLVGAGPQESELQEYVSANHLTNVIFEGRKEGVELYACMSAADVLVLPSSFEPYGAVVSEALQLGAPVLVSDRVGAKSLVESGKNGEIFEFNNADDFYKKLSSILELELALELKNRPSLQSVELSDCVNNLVEKMR